MPPMPPPRPTKPAFHRECRTSGRKAVIRWLPRERWPETWQMTHGSQSVDDEVFHGFVFRSEEDAAIFDTAVLAPEVRPQPVAFASWDDAVAWLDSANPH